MIKDSYGRPVRSIRISVTQRCNLSCFYCHREGEYTDAETEMTLEEIEKIISVAASLKIGKVKITGGEPLLRSDILEIVQRIKDTSGVSEVSMTTNGTLLSGYAEPLKEAGLARVNISLNTLRPETFKMIAGVDALKGVISGIEEAVKVGLSPVKINMVLLRGVNEDDVFEMVDFAREKDLVLQLIELESADENETYGRYHLGLDGIEDQLRWISEKVTLREMHHRRKYCLKGGVMVEIVKPMHNTEFCRYCNRIRVTSDGKLKPCLFRSDNHIDFLGPMREEASEETLKELFLEAVKKRKPYFK